MEKEAPCPVADSAVTTTRLSRDRSSVPRVCQPVQAQPLPWHLIGRLCIGLRLITCQFALKGSSTRQGTHPTSRTRPLTFSAAMCTGWLCFLNLASTHPVFYNHAKEKKITTNVQTKGTARCAVGSCKSWVEGLKGFFLYLLVHTTRGANAQALSHFCAVRQAEVTPPRKRKSRPVFQLSRYQKTITVSLSVWTLQRPNAIKDGILCMLGKVFFLNITMLALLQKVIFLTSLLSRSGQF